ncbi:1873_t:CDS:2 [Ambispora gerdemannii]|uniref:1873_t:CDS:1 n=1 Tax=Ambispora gerdemannii TaxID=144530 RepID=A0A9N8VS99_9GLOM|nr:1873_t:CDS:2 [Ambispora gerdemannii]
MVYKLRKEVGQSIEKLNLIAIRLINESEKSDLRLAAQTVMATSIETTRQCAVVIVALLIYMERFIL